MIWGQYLLGFYHEFKSKMITTEVSVGMESELNVKVKFQKTNSDYIFGYLGMGNL